MTAHRWADDPEPIRPAPLSDLPLFSPVEVKTMARRGDAETSKAAAIAISDTLNALQARVYEAFLEKGAMGGRQAENLPEFATLAPSTVRKRITELVRAGYLTPTDRIEAGCRVYAPKGENHV